MVRAFPKVLWFDKQAASVFEIANRFVAIVVEQDATLAVSRFFPLLLDGLLIGGFPRLLGQAQQQVSEKEVGGNEDIENGRLLSILMAGRISFSDRASAIPRGNGDGLRFANPSYT